MCTVCETEVAVRGGVQVVIGMVRSSLEECPFGSQGGRVMSADMMTVGKFQEIITAGEVKGCRSGQMAKKLAVGTMTLASGKR